MKLKFAVAAGAFAFLALATPQITAAATVGPHTAIPGMTATGGLPVEKVQWGGHCRAWARECGARWGWGNWRFQRCMAFHGC